MSGERADVVRTRPYFAGTLELSATIENNKRIVQEFLAAMSARDWVALDRICDPEVVWFVPGVPELIPVAGAHKGTKDIVKFLSRAILEFGTEGQRPGGNRMDVRHVLGEGDRVIVEHEVFATTKKGKDYNNSYCLSFLLKGGRIVEIREYEDSLYAYHQGMFRD
jgi:ketosteroid isomerase-like protein